MQNSVDKWMDTMENKPMGCTTSTSRINAERLIPRSRSKDSRGTRSECRPKKDGFIER